MSFYFRDKPKFGDRLRGKSGDELLQEIKQQFDEDSKSFFEPRSSRDSFDRQSSFSRGFPFDDDGFGRRSDIRAHLDDLAARHPEFADHLLGPPWGDIPFHSSFRNRNRGSGNSGNNYQGYSDEDARSQASGSSAASGASAVSSHGEAESNHNQQDRRYENPEQTRRSQIPQYGLRNTVDIGQHHHNMENPDKANNRGQRSMSAPPENRQTCNLQQPQQQEQTPQPQGQRYVSRIDITPQHNQPQQQQKPQQQPPQQPQQQPQQKSQQGNVRHIPIFVEGRDEPVMPRSFDEPHFRREPSPTQFQTPPYFQRPFGQHFAGRSHQRSPHFQDPFYQSPSSFEHPSRRQQQAPNYQQQPRQQQYTDRQPQQQYYEQPKQPQRQQPQQQYPPQQQQQQQQQQQEQEPPRPKPVVPKDPLERVAMVQKEVDSLAEQVKQYTGNSRTDKEYIYLDEMLTRELIKLDDIETEGRDNVRQARRNTIKSIQETISFLESKAPLPSQQTSLEEQEKQEDQASNKEETGQTESMDVDQKQEDQSQSKEPIPLPPVPSSPTEQSEEASTEKMDDSSKDQPMSQQQEASQTSGEPMDTASSDKPGTTPMEVQENTEKQKNDAEQTVQNVPEEKKSKNVPEEKKPESVAEEKKSENVSEEKKPENPSAENASEVKPEGVPEETKQEANASKAAVESQPQKPVEKMEVDTEVKQSPKLQKKGKKTKKQAPVSDKAIPLPAPESAEATAK